MKKYLWIIVAALTIVGCAHKPAQQEDQTEQEQVEEQEATTAVVGGRYLDFTGVTPLAEELSLSDLVGKTDYVLVDFWASWCGPCRRFIPVLKEIYASQPAGRLEIISCSVDQDALAWYATISEEQMPWKQVREDAEHPCADKYNVQFIPHTVLIDREGKIVAINAEEPELEEILLGK